MNRKTILTYLVLFAVLAFAARLGTDIYFKAWRAPSAMEHRPIAQALVHGKGFTFGDWKYYGPTSAQSPPFPFLLASMYKIFGAVDADGQFVTVDIVKTDSMGKVIQTTHTHPGEENAYIAIMVINALAGAGLVFLVYQMTRTLGGTPLAGLIAAGLVAIWPSQIYAARFVQAIALITCGLVGMVTLYYRAVRNGRPGTWAGYSYLAALVTLIEPVFLPGMLLSGGLMFITRKLSFQAKLRNCFILAFAMLTVIGPWTMRNYIVHGKLIPIKGSFWVNMWKGNNDYATGTDRLKLTPKAEAAVRKEIARGNTDSPEDTPHQYDMLDPSQRARLENHPETEREVWFKQYALEWIKAHPDRYAELCKIRFEKTLWIDWDNPRSVIKVYIYSRAAILFFTIGGLAVALRRRWSLAYPALIALTALATYTLTITAARFAFPFEPIQLALAGGFLACFLPDPDKARQMTSNGRGFEPVMRETAMGM